MVDEHLVSKYLEGSSAGTGSCTERGMFVPVRCINVSAWYGLARYNIVQYCVVSYGPVNWHSMMGLMA